MLQLLNFVAAWATPCSEYTSLLEQFQSKYPSIRVQSIDVEQEENAALLDLYQVESVPCVVFLEKEENKEEKAQSVLLKKLEGFEPILLEQYIQQYTNASGSAPEASPAVQSDNIQGTTIEDRIEKLISSDPLVLFIKGTPTEPQCGFTRQLLALLTQQYSYSTFKSYDILKDPIMRESLKKIYQWPTFPMVFYQGEFIGGLDIVKETLLNNQGKLTI